MAHIDELVSKIPDARLRRDLAAAVKELKAAQKFGLKFEKHLPEQTILPDCPVTEGAIVARRDRLRADALFRVCEIAGSDAVLQSLAEPSAEPVRVSVADLRVVKRFGEPIYPTLSEVARVVNADAARPFHALVNAENFHAVQLLLYLYEGQVDCLYLDPPYNTGARDWTYNNQYVDSNDTYRHSKWLSFMEKRLRLAKRLLKPDGVLIVTIDEHEVHHLGLLLADVFSDYLRYMVTIVISSQGNDSDNFARVDEYAYFCCPKIGREVISDKYLFQIRLGYFQGHS